MSICTTFLQLRYHTDGEYLPDRFHMEDLSSGVIEAHSDAVTQSKIPHSESDGESADSACKHDVDDETAERKLATMTIQAILENEPHHNAATGPGCQNSPRKYIGVVKPAILYESMCMWAMETCRQPIPSFATFRRALRNARPWLRFRVLIVISFQFSNMCVRKQVQTGFKYIVVIVLMLRLTDSDSVRSCASLRKGSRPTWFV